MMYELGNYQKSHVVIDELRDMAARYALVAITGAGISVESGLPIASERINGIEVNDVFTERIWTEDPVRAYGVYRAMLTMWRTAKPNAAHLALGSRQIPVITQNVDGLHLDAGSRHVIELHGNLRELRCMHCEALYSSQMCLEASVPVCPSCCRALFPGFTLEGEPVRHIARASEWVGRAEMLLVVGTSLSMYPVRKLKEMALQRSLPVIWVNEEAERWVSTILHQEE